MDSMVGTAMTIERERSRMHRALGIRVLVARGRRVSLLPVREISRGLLVYVCTDPQPPGLGIDRVASQVRRMVCYHCQQPRHMRKDSLRDKDPRVSGQRSPSLLWDRRGYNLFLHSPVQARGASISFRELHEHLLLHRQARGARLWVEAEDGAHR